LSPTIFSHVIALADFDRLIIFRFDATDYVNVLSDKADSKLVSSYVHRGHFGQFSSLEIDFMTGGRHVVLTGE
jgi:hypothetical protein